MPAKHLLVLAILMAFLAGCAQRQSTSLYAQLGGEAGVAAIVEDFTLRLAYDPEIVVFFANSNIDRFVASLEDQICELAGGPCRYEGPPMDRAHQHMGITDAHFNALVEHMQETLIDQGVAPGPRNRLLGKLAGLHGDIMSLQ